MGTIIKNAIRERIRRKEAYVVLAIALFLLFFCSGENSTIMIDGESLTGFHNMFMVMHVLVHTAGCILAVLLSYRTIPNEYARKTSHLVWVRGISQPVYHGGLTIANILASIGGLGLLYFAMAVYALLQGQSACVLRLIPRFFVMAVSVALVSLWTSVVSIRLPAGITAAFGVLGAGTGVLWSALDLLRSSLGGVTAVGISALIHVIPNLNGVQKCAYHIAAGKVPVWHPVLVALFAAWVLVLGIFAIRRKEA